MENLWKTCQEFMSGGSLHDRLFGKKAQALAPRQRWLISCHTAEGLAFLHSQRVVHRDLPLGSVFRRPAGQRPCESGESTGEMHCEML